MASDAPLLFVPVGRNAARPFGLDPRERACRLASNAGLECADGPVEGRPVLLASMRYAWDPAWVAVMSARPGAMLTLRDEPVMAHVPGDGNPVAAAAGLEDHEPVEGYDLLPVETAELWKGHRPYVILLEPDETRQAERAIFEAAYGRVADLLTAYLWRGPAFSLTRRAARAGIAPGLVTLGAAVLSVIAFYLFWRGDYWWGVLASLTVMLLDTVGGTLARVTGSSSRWGDGLRYGIDLIVPPFWYWAWEQGLASYGRPLEPVFAMMVLWAVVGGYIAQRLIEGLFAGRFGVDMHAWKLIDSRFRLVSASRNINMTILIVSLLLRRPDAGLELVAGWTIVSLIYDAVRLAQARERFGRGEPIISWFEP